MIKILKRDLRKEIVEIQDEEGNIVPQEQKVIPSIEYKSIEETDSSIILLFGFNNNGVKEEKKLLLDKEIYKGQIIDVVAVCAKERFELNILSHAKIIDYNLKRVISNQNSNFFRVVRVVFEPGGDIIIALSSAYDDIEGFENIKIDSSSTLSGKLCELSAFYNANQQAIDRKYSMLKEVDIYKSVSYLEAQVDVLTRALLAILPNTNNLYDVLQLADEKSVLNIKPIEDIKKEFTESKANLRKQQEDYYITLHGAENEENISS